MESTLTQKIVEQEGGLPYYNSHTRTHPYHLTVGMNRQEVGQLDEVGEAFGGKTRSETVRLLVFIASTSLRGETTDEDKEAWVDDLAKRLSKILRQENRR